jgi:hypothetical protein
MMVRRFALVLLYSAAALAAANAADVPVPIQPPEAVLLEDGWTFAASSYFWAAGMSGNVGQFGLPPAHLESDFGDILSDLDFAFMGIAEARNDRFSLFGDVIYTKISSGTATPFGIVADRVDVMSETFIGLAGRAIPYSRTIGATSISWEARVAGTQIPISPSSAVWVSWTNIPTGQHGSTQWQVFVPGTSLPTRFI